MTHLAELAAVVSQAAQSLRVRDAYLVGSRATGVGTETSDFDVILVVDGPTTTTGWLSPDQVPSVLARDLGGVSIDWCIVSIVDFDEDDIALFTKAGRKFYRPERTSAHLSAREAAQEAAPDAWRPGS